MAKRFSAADRIAEQKALEQRAAQQKVTGQKPGMSPIEAQADAEVRSGVESVQQVFADYGAKLTQVECGALARELQTLKREGGSQATRERIGQLEAQINAHIQSGKWEMGMNVGALREAAKQEATSRLNETKYVSYTAVEQIMWDDRPHSESYLSFSKPEVVQIPAVEEQVKKRAQRHIEEALKKPEVRSALSRIPTEGLSPAEYQQRVKAVLQPHVDTSIEMAKHPVKTFLKKVFGG